MSHSAGATHLATLFRATVICALALGWGLGCLSEPDPDPEDDAQETPDPGVPLDDDDDRGEGEGMGGDDDCNLLIRIARDPALPPLAELMKMWVGVLRPEAVNDRGQVRGEAIVERTVYTPGRLTEPDDRYVIRFCAPRGDVAVVLHLDANWDDDACTEGDYAGWALAEVGDDETILDLVVDHIQGEADCGH